jgi:hypothetical protein
MLIDPNKNGIKPHNVICKSQANEKLDLPAKHAYTLLDLFLVQDSTFSLHDETRFHQSLNLLVSNLVPPIPKLKPPQENHSGLLPEVSEPSVLPES